MTRFEIGTAVGLAVAIIGGAVWVGMLEGRMRGLENTNAIKEAKDRAIAEIDSRLQHIELPAGSVLFFNDGNGSCPDGWRPMDRVGGRFLMAANERFSHGSTGGGAVTLRLENIPPHKHKMKHFPMSQGKSNSLTNWTSSKGKLATTGPVSRGTPHLGHEDVHSVAEPFDVIPPYLALTLCIKELSLN